MIKFTDSDLTIRVKGADFSEAEGIYLNLRQGEVRVQLNEDMMDIDGEYVTTHLDQTITGMFDPTEGYNTQDCEAIINWFIPDAEPLYPNRNYKRLASSIVKIPVYPNIWDSEVLR